MKKCVFFILGMLLTTAGFCSNYWNQEHVTPDNNGGYYIHKPGTSAWQDDHVIPDLNGGYYYHKSGTSAWEDKHITSDGHGGYYY